MTTFPRWCLRTTITVLFISMTAATNAQEVHEQASPVEHIDANIDEAEIRTVPEPSIQSINQRQPNTKAELEAVYGPEALAIVNEQLRQEIELLAREYRASERRNDIQLFGLGAIVALIFLGIGFMIGKRFGGRRLL